MEKRIYNSNLIIDNFYNHFQEHKFIFDNMDDVVWSMSWPELKVEFISKAVEDSIGYSVEEFENDPLFLQKITHPDDKKINEKALENLKNKGFTDRKFRVISKNGKVKWMHDKGKMIYDEDNNPVRVEGIIKDITERKEAEIKLRYKEKRYRTIFNTAPIGIIIEDKAGKIIDINDMFCEMTGYTKEELKGNNVLDKLVIPENRELAQKNIKKILEGNDLSFDIKTPSKNNEPKYYHVKETQIILPDGSKGIISMHIDITERKEKENKIRDLAYKDSLTNLYNRKFFEEELKRLDTKRQLPISIIMGDLNGLKIINDSYGQKKGDQLLIKTAEMLKEVIRADDILARYGGDEFTILLPQTTNKTAQEIAKRIKLKSKEQTIEEVTLSISLGTATKEDRKQELTNIISTAEDNMYQNKLSESRSSKSNIVQGLLNTLNAKSSETKEHAVRMTKLAFDFGEELGLSTSELNRLSLLATLHDIGKTSISEKILKKPGKLNDSEWEMIKEHPERGCKIASASEEFALVAEEILAHHERWEGGGYPKGLKGKEISYLARIIAIIDSYDVMTNDRPYSKAMTQKEALREIKSCSGSQFDPYLVEKFLEVMKEN